MSLHVLLNVNLTKQSLLDSVLALLGEQTYVKAEFMLGLCYMPQPSASADNIKVGLDNSHCHAENLIQ